MITKPQKVDDGSFRTYAPYCEICGIAGNLYNHHYFSRGAGGPSVRLNRLTVCFTCHAKCHSGQIKRARQLEIIAKREGMAADDVEAKLYAMRRGDIE